MVITLSVIGLLTVLILLGRIRALSQFRQDVTRLFSNVDVSSGKFSYKQLADLPAPVAAYFRYVLKDGQPFISSARLTHDGQFKTDLKRNWIAIEGEQYFSISPPGFIWKGNTNLFSARDMYIHDKGRLAVFLFSVIKIVDERGDIYAEAELQRWLAECVWFPTNLLPGKYVSWEAIDSSHATLIFNYNTMSISFRVTFNKKGEIVEFETTRFMRKDKRETWIGTLWNYQEHHGIRIPTTIEVKWVLGSDHLPYARFHVKKIEYNKPFRF